MIYSILFLKGGDIMRCTVLGVRHIEYDNREGRHIKGTRIYVSYIENGTDGVACMEVFLNQNIVPPRAGEEIVIMYNNRGRVVSVETAG